MKTLVQYLIAVVLVLLGIALLRNPSPPAETSQIQPQQGSSAEPLDRPTVRPIMRLV